MISNQAITAAIIGVSSITDALKHWQDSLGFRQLRYEQGADPSLEKFWNLPTGSIHSQVLLGNSNANTGQIWLIEFTAPGAPVRSDAAVTDRCPKSVNLAMRDLPERFAKLSAAGFRFRSPFVTYPANGLTINEMQWLAPDDINVGMLELVGIPFPFNEQGVAGFTNFVTIVGDLAAEVAFFNEVLGMPLYARHRLQGEAVEKIVGLPSGTVLNMQLLGLAERPFGRCQLIEYEGAQGSDLFERAVPPALGLLHAVMHSDALETLKGKLDGKSVPYAEMAAVKTIYDEDNDGSHAISCRTPAGLRLDILGH